VPAQQSVASPNVGDPDVGQNRRGPQPQQGPLPPAPPEGIQGSGFRVEGECGPAGRWPPSAANSIGSKLPGLWMTGAAGWAHLDQRGPGAVSSGLADVEPADDVLAAANPGEPLSSLVIGEKAFSKAASLPARLNSSALLSAGPRRPHPRRRASAAVRPAGDGRSGISREQCASDRRSHGRFRALF